MERRRKEVERKELEQNKNNKKKNVKKLKIKTWNIKCRKGQGTAEGGEEKRRQRSRKKKINGEISTKFYYSGLCKQIRIHNRFRVYHIYTTVYIYLHLENCLKLVIHFKS